MAIEAGRVLSQRYRLIRPVGQGSQASVWVAEHLALTTHVAVKLIDQDLAKKDSARERFRREATAAAQLRSAHVVQILDHGIDGDQPFIVMELLDGEDLFERLAHRSRLSLRETSKIVTQVARALSRAHQAGIVHRDLKPENVFLVPNEDDEVVKVLDFGVAKVKDAAKVTMQKTGVGTLIGTPHYMSPEQVKGIVEVDYRTDLWALGVIAFQCVTGELPYDSEGVGDLLIKITIGELPVPSKIYPGIAPSFDTWFMKACARDAASRFQSAREMALALAGIVNTIDGVAPRAPTVRPPAAAIPSLTRSVPQPPRVPALDDELEELDPFEEDEDDRPTRMRPPGASSPPAPPAVIKSASGTAVGLAPPRPKPSTAPGPLAVPQPPKPASAAAPPAGPAPPPRTPAPPVASVPPPAPAAADAHDSHDIVDFDDTIPATDARVAAAGFVLPPRKAAAAPIAEAPPRAPSPLPEPPAPIAPPPPPSHRQILDVAPQAVIAPVFTAPPRISAPEPPPSVPRAPTPAPSAPRAPSPPPSAPSVARAAAPPPRPVELEAPSHPGVLVPDDDADLGGFGGSSKRRRMVRLMVAGLVIFAVGITWTVVRSQYDGASGVSGASDATTATATAVATPMPVAPPPPPPVMPATTASAVDPGKTTHPTKPLPSGFKKGPLVRPRGHWEGNNDGTITIPEPPPD